LYPWVKKFFWGKLDEYSDPAEWPATAGGSFGSCKFRLRRDESEWEAYHENFGRFQLDFTQGYKSKATLMRADVFVRFL
jgi:hypothetical protein